MKNGKIIDLLSLSLSFFRRCFCFALRANALVDIGDYKERCLLKNAANRNP